MQNPDPALDKLLRAARTTGPQRRTVWAMLHDAIGSDRVTRNAQPIKVIVEIVADAGALVWHPVTGVTLDGQEVARDRRWVLSFEGPLAQRLGYDETLLSEVAEALARAVMQDMRWAVKERHGLGSVEPLHAGVFMVVQRFRSDLGLRLTAVLAQVHKALATLRLTAIESELAVRELEARVSDAIGRLAEPTHERVFWATPCVEAGRLRPGRRGGRGTGGRPCRRGRCRCAKGP